MTRKLLESVRRDISYINTLLDSIEARGDQFPLTHKDQWLFWIIRLAYEQQRYSMIMIHIVVRTTLSAFINLMSDLSREGKSNRRSSLGQSSELAWMMVLPESIPSAGMPIMRVVT